MQRDTLLLTEMIDAAEQAQQLTAGVTVSQLETDRQRHDALLWNFTVLGEAAGQLSLSSKTGSRKRKRNSPSRPCHRIRAGALERARQAAFPAGPRRLAAATAGGGSILPARTLSRSSEPSGTVTMRPKTT